jgi:hypothetical protein
MNGSLEVWNARQETQASKSRKARQKIPASNIKNEAQLVLEMPALDVVNAYDPTSPSIKSTKTNVLGDQTLIQSVWDSMEESGSFGPEQEDLDLLAAGGELRRTAVDSWGKDHDSQKAAGYDSADASRRLQVSVDQDRISEYHRTPADSWWLDPSHRRQFKAAGKNIGTADDSWWLDSSYQIQLSATGNALGTAADSWWLKTLQQELLAAEEESLGTVDDSWWLDPSHQKRFPAREDPLGTAADSWRPSTSNQNQLEATVGSPGTADDTLIFKTADQNAKSAVSLLETMELGCPALLSCVELSKFEHCKKVNQIFLIDKEIQNGAIAKSYMRKGFLIYEEMLKYFPIYEEAVSHI